MNNKKIELLLENERIIKAMTKRQSNNIQFLDYTCKDYNEAIILTESYKQELIEENRFESLLYDLREINKEDDFFYLTDNNILKVNHWTLEELDKFLKILEVYDEKVLFTENYKYLVYDNMI